MKPQRWGDLSRTTLARVLPEAVVVFPLGATEQHGTHLATSTDITIAEALVQRAAALAAHRSARPIIFAPALPIGASQHHLPFGGTVSMHASTLLRVLGDILTSMVDSGARRILLVNGHGGNVGVCHAAASELSAAQSHVSCAHVNYWDLLPTRADLLDGAGTATTIPGHAGQFETSLMLALTGRTAVEGFAVEGMESESAVSPGAEGSVSHDAARSGLVGEEHEDVSAMVVHSQARWQRVNGCSDSPGGATAAEGRLLLQQLSEELAKCMIATAAEE